VKPLLPTSSELRASRPGVTFSAGLVPSPMKYQIVMRKDKDGKFRPYRKGLTVAEVAAHFAEFYKVVDRGHSTPCWEWQNPLRTTKTSGKYGIRTIGGVKLVASRLSWNIHHGPIPDGKCVLHHCDNPPCVNPDHLFLGTKPDNNHDRHRKGRDVFQVGSKHYAAFLNEDIVRQIRELHRRGWRLVDLATTFEISMCHCWGIVNRRSWRHIP
jgi:HNH endonuclease